MELDDHEKSVLQDFLGDKWASFVAFAAERDMDEAQCDDLANKLDH